MTRPPPRPLIRIFEARRRGEDPDMTGRESGVARHERARDQARLLAEKRLLFLGGLFLCAFLVVSVRMGHLAASPPSEPRNSTPGDTIISQRADITDRHGRILATNIPTHSLYAQPRQMIDKAGAARALAGIFDDLDEAALLERFSGRRSFIWIRRKLSPEQMQAVHEIGEPGLLLGPREMRLYPNGRLASHILGGARFGREGVQSAEVVGRAGMERGFDDYLRDPAAGGAPLQLSIDLTVQAAAERVLAGSMGVTGAEGAAAVLMDVKTGEVISMVSLPDFDPNDRPQPIPDTPAARSPRFNRAVQGVYELGSTFKIFTVAQALEEGMVDPSSMVDTKGPLRWGRHRIRDFHDYGPELSVSDVIVRSSNIGTARLAQRIGAERQRAFLSALGLLEPTPLEMPEARAIRPLLPPKWSELSTMTISYGHGVSTSPLHLAAAYATLVNGGFRVTPTLLKRDAPGGAGAPEPTGPRVISGATSRIVRDMLRQVVSRGTASLGDVRGYAVGGKTGSADKPRENGGGYHDDKVIATFAAVFPSAAPEYVLVVTLDEPEVLLSEELRRTAGWTAVPVAAEIISRIAPILGLRPVVEPAPASGVILVRNNG